MVSKDMLQMNRKLKHPYLRKWYSSKKGDDTFRQAKLTKKMKDVLRSMPKEAKENYFIAHKGKEYGADEYLKKFIRKKKRKKR